MRTTPRPDYFILRQRDSGQTWVAAVDRWTRDGRPYLWWYRKDGSGGHEKGKPSKPRLLDEKLEEIVGPATPMEIDAFLRRAKR